MHKPEKWSSQSITDMADHGGAVNRVWQCPQKEKSTTASSGQGLPAAKSGRGGYYLDDGPMDVIPDGLYDVPNAVPRVEPYARGPNKPYVVFGKRYVPFTDERPYKVKGFGSWYGKKFHGKKTSSGEPYDMFKMTAAHPTLPIPSYARVTNVNTGAQVIVRVNDRGPFLSDRVIDLSYTAALKLGYLNKGSGQVEVERILHSEIRDMSYARKTASDMMQPQAAKTASKPASPPPAATSGNGQFFLQMGAYQKEEAAESVTATYAMEWAHLLPSVKVVRAGQFYKVYGGPFKTQEEARRVAEQMRQSAATLNPVVIRP